MTSTYDVYIKTTSLGPTPSIKVGQNWLQHEPKRIFILDSMCHLGVWFQGDLFRTGKQPIATAWNEDGIGLILKKSIHKSLAILVIWPLTQNSLKCLTMILLCTPIGTHQVGATVTHWTRGENKCQCSVSGPKLSVPGIRNITLIKVSNGH